jgi:hypothetical protein
MVPLLFNEAATQRVLDASDILKEHKNRLEAVGKVGAAILVAGELGAVVVVAVFFV